MTMSFSDFAARVLDGVGAEPTAGVRRRTGLYDELGLDSLQALQLLFMIETMAGCDVPPVELPRLFTMGDAFDYFETLLSIASASPGYG